MTGYIEMPNDPSLVINDEENEEDLEPNRWNSKEIHSRYNIPVISKKGHPGLLLFLVRVFGFETSQIAGNSRFRNIVKTQHQQF